MPGHRCGDGLTEVDLRRAAKAARAVWTLSRIPRENLSSCLGGGLERLLVEAGSACPTIHSPSPHVRLSFTPPKVGKMQVHFRRDTQFDVTIGLYSWGAFLALPSSALAQ